MVRAPTVNVYVDELVGDKEKIRMHGKDMTCGWQKHAHYRENEPSQDDEEMQFNNIFAISRPEE